MIAVKRGVADGIYRLHVAELVRDAIENAFLTVLRETGHESQIEARLAAIRQRFDRVRGRMLRH